MLALNAPHLSSWLRLNDEKKGESCERRESDDFYGKTWGWKKGERLERFVGVLVIRSCVYCIFYHSSDFQTFRTTKIDSHWKDFHSDYVTQKLSQEVSFDWISWLLLYMFANEHQQKPTGFNSRKVFCYKQWEKRNLENSQTDSLCTNIDFQLMVLLRNVVFLLIRAHDKLDFPFMTFMWKLCYEKILIHFWVDRNRYDHAISTRDLVLILDNIN